MVQRKPYPVPGSNSTPMDNRCSPSWTSSVADHKTCPKASMISNDRSKVPLACKVTSTRRMGSVTSNSNQRALLGWYCPPGCTASSPPVPEGPVVTWLASAHNVVDSVTNGRLTSDPSATKLPPTSASNHWISAPPVASAVNRIDPGEDKVVSGEVVGASVGPSNTTTSTSEDEMALPHWSSTDTE